MDLCLWGPCWYLLAGLPCRTLDDGTGYWILATRLRSELAFLRLLHVNALRMRVILFTCAFHDCYMHVIALCVRAILFACALVRDASTAGDWGPSLLTQFN